MCFKNIFKKDKQNKMEENNMAKYDETYWNNKWPKAPIIYQGRTLKLESDRIGVDVKTFISQDDEILKEIVKKYKLKKSTDNETAWAVQKFVVKKLTYKYDDESVKVPEYWQFPFETVQGRVGDCEDGAILIAALCINAGIPAYRVKVAAGYVQSSPTAPQGGHGYCIYLASDDNWRILDWCIVDNKRTLIQTPNGAKRISQLKEGDYVIGYDEEKNEPALTKIEKLGNRPAKNIFKLEFENGEPIYATGEHPFYVNGKWVPTEELEIGMEPYWVKPQKLFNQFHDYKKDPWRQEAAWKTAKKNKESGLYKELSERQKKNNIFTRKDVRKKLSENNCMKNPEIMMKAYKTRENGKISGPESKFAEYCKEHNLPVEFTGDGKYWIKTSDGPKNPDFHIPGTKKVIEVSDTSFEYFRCWEDYKKERTQLFEEKGYKVEFVLFDRNKFDESFNKENLHSFVLNGNKITNITMVQNIKTSKYKNGTTVWNMHCSPHNNYFVNGNLVHNCYYEDSTTPVLRKPLAREGGYKGCYKDVWFTFNNEYSWNQQNLTVSGRISENQTAEKKDSVDASKKVLKMIVEGFSK